jgi:DNA-binding NarL/FixJ family response regulator
MLHPPCDAVRLRLAALHREELNAEAAQERRTSGRDSAPAPGWMKEAPVKTHPRKLVLKKIAARRERADRPEARPAWVTLLTGNASEDVQPERGFTLLRPRILTPREIEVLHLVARGETDRSIAERLYLSRRTVSSHVSNILAKLDVPSRRAAVIAAARIGLL